MATLRLINPWAAFTDDELLVLERSLDDVEAHAHVDCPPVPGAAGGGSQKRLTPSLSSWYSHLAAWRR
jgi:hypothetical protein